MSYWHALFFVTYFRCVTSFAPAVNDHIHAQYKKICGCMCNAGWPVWSAFTHTINAHFAPRDKKKLMEMAECIVQLYNATKSGGRHCVTCGWLAPDTVWAASEQQGQRKLVPWSAAHGIMSMPSAYDELLCVEVHYYRKWNLIGVLELVIFPLSQTIKIVTKFQQALLLVYMVTECLQRVHLVYCFWFPNGLWQFAFMFTFCNQLFWKLLGRGPDYQVPVLDDSIWLCCMLVGLSGTFPLSECSHLKLLPAFIQKCSIIVYLCKCSLVLTVVFPHLFGFIIVGRN